MQAQIRKTARGILHEAGVGKDYRVDAKIRGEIEGTRPALERAGLGVRIERKKNLAAMRVRITHTLSRGLGIEIEAAEIPGVGVVAKADIHAIGAVVDCGF
jgi:hypothetical protein